MRHVFAQIREGMKGETESLILFSGDQAEKLIEDPEKFIEEYGNGASITGRWVVPDSLENPTSFSDDVTGAFNALLHLNTLASFPVVGDLFAAIFQFGFKCGQQSMDDHHGFTTFTAP